MIDAGIDAERVGAMQDSARKTCVARIEDAFRQIRNDAKRGQQDVSQSLPRSLQKMMNPCYDEAYSVNQGTGTFKRMKQAFRREATEVFETLFTDLSDRLSNDVGGLISRIFAKISSNLQLVIYKGLETVFSVCLESLTDNPDLIDLEKEAAIVRCRKELLPRFYHIGKTRDEAMEIMGI